MGLSQEYTKGQTPLDENEIDGLLIKTILTKKELDELEQVNIEKAIEWTVHSNLNKDIILKDSFIKRLHKQMFGDVWKWAGKFRQSNKNIGCQWFQIPTQLKELFDDTNYWIENDIYSPLEITIRFKHKLVSIHCFPNGNGRHSRLMADILYSNVFDNPPLNWSNSSIQKSKEIRKKYILSLKEADKGNINPLMKFSTD